MRRGIRKAEDSGLRVVRDTSLEAMHTFYHLHCLTRRRHGVPPQPVRFFENIARYMLDSGHGYVFTAVIGARILAAAVFFHSKDRAVYKFGASDPGFQELRPNNLLLWEAIKSYTQSGQRLMHFGRTSLSGNGLRRFKLGFGAEEERIEYRRYDFASNAHVTGRDRTESWATAVFRRLPLPFLRMTGNVLYPHLS
jgi:lipid II:glycine glycyltransferase (peptidoglycan interpeptide bridge formation enzyme)